MFSPCRELNRRGVRLFVPKFVPAAVTKIMTLRLIEEKINKGGVAGNIDTTPCNIHVEKDVNVILTNLLKIKKTPTKLRHQLVLPRVMTQVMRMKR